MATQRAEKTAEEQVHDFDVAQNSSVLQLNESEISNSKHGPTQANDQAVENGTSHEAHQYDQQNHSIPEVVVEYFTGANASAYDRNSNLALLGKAILVTTPTNGSQHDPSHDSCKKETNIATAGAGLREILERESVLCADQGRPFILSRTVVQQLITIPAVASDIRANDPSIPEHKAQEYAERVCDSTRPAKQLYAILSRIGYSGDIGVLLNEGLHDAELPLSIYCKEHVQVNKQDGSSVAVMEAWDEQRLTSFSRFQLMTAPVLRNLEYYDFPPDTILPFLYSPSTRKLRLDRYASKYSSVHIHPEHHDFWPTSHSKNIQNEPLVAIKQLHVLEDAAFMREETILRELASKNHPHIIKLLATYKRNNVYNLLFPHAETNFRTYCNNHPFPDLGTANLLWSLRQLKGIVSALEVIHNFSGRPSLHKNPLLVAEMTEQTHLSADRSERLSSRHGNIQADNILWFPKDTSARQDPRGILQIAGIGLGRFQGHDGPRTPNNEILAVPSYAAPESKLRLSHSSRSDIWSLGCFFLEFVTWLLQGAMEVYDFADFRSVIDPETGFDEDIFYILLPEGSDGLAAVNPKVYAWVEQLKAAPGCSRLLLDLLDYTMTDMLVAKPWLRATASKIHLKLVGFLQQAEASIDYLLKP